MADLKISQLSSATALAGTEVVPVVQGGSTKKATIDQILAPASGKGIDFSAADGDTLTMYDEGTWTPVDTSGAGLTLTNEATATYTRIGRTVVANYWVKYPVTASGAGASIGGLPFTSASGVSGSVIINQTEYAVPFTGAVQQGTAQTTFFTFGNTQLTNTNLSNLRVRATVIYFV